MKELYTIDHNYNKDSIKSTQVHLQLQHIFLNDQENKVFCL